MSIGDAHISAQDQQPQLQSGTLKGVGCEQIFEEKTFFKLLLSGYTVFNCFSVGRRDERRTGRTGCRDSLTDREHQYHDIRRTAVNLASARGREGAIAKTFFANLDISVQEIAPRQEVSISTLYKHIPAVRGTGLETDSLGNTDGRNKET